MRTAAGLLATCALLAACSAEAPPRASYQRLELRADPPYPDVVARQVARLEPSKDDGASGSEWRGEAPGGARLLEIFGQPSEDPGSEDPKDAPVTAVLLEGDALKSVTIPGRFDPRAFNHATIGVTSFGSNPEFARVECLRDGKVLAQSEWLSFRSSKYPQLVPCPLPALRRVTGEFDELRVQLAGRTTTSAVSRLDLARLPEHPFQPPAQGPGRVTPLGEEARRAFGLSSRHDLTAPVHVPPRAELVFAYGSKPALRIPGENATLRVSVERSGTTLVSQEWQEAPAPGWTSVRVDLAEYADSEVEVRFQLEVAGEHEGFALIAEPALRTGGAAGRSVLLVTSDTHRADHIAIASDHPKVETPALDALAKRGVLFEDCFASTNVTNPSHVALMTATHPRDTRIVNNNQPLVADASTLAEQFAAAGYRTFAAVSAHHLADERSGLGQGFERLDAPQAAERAGNATVDVLESWLAETDGEPLFVWLHLFDAHAPYTPPPGFDRKYYKSQDDPFDPANPAPLPERLVPHHLKGLSDMDFPYEQYRAEVDFLDTQMARVLAQPVFADAIVAFTADHGEAFGQKGVYWDHAELYPSTVHVPLILSWPGGPRGVRAKAPVRQIDVARTLLELAQVESKTIGGRDLRWALEAGAAEDARFLLSSHGFSAAVNSGGWLLILHLVDHWQEAVAEGRKAHAVELYDLRNDPECAEDLVDAEPRRARELRAALVEWLARADARGLAGSSAMSLEAAENLAALGYGGGPDDGPEDGTDAWYVPDPENEWCKRFED